ncbi:MAG TPA: NADH-quinone oxidoreductase subunit J [Geobacteraceae bacterium]|nr:NADH-quinone oxidoreductase subunit J [Geobacteraceae bacterium]
MQMLTEGVFVIFIIFIFAGGYVAVSARYLMDAVLGLALSLLGVAGLYFRLGSPFLALMQTLIYVGAVCVIIAFGIMVGPKSRHHEERRIMGRRNFILAASAVAVGFVLLAGNVIGAGWVPAAAVNRDFSVAFLGQNLLFNFCLAFELISVLLLTAILGALIIANIGREENRS